MNDIKIKSIRSFVGAKDYEASKTFYKMIGFEIIEISSDMCLLKIENFSFYLQDAYVKDWIENTMIFLELDNPEAYLKTLEELNLTNTFKGVKLSKMVYTDWGKEFFLHDPSGVLWHIGNFK